jgi:Zn-dependent M28 family amino/carboxypeptidase
VLNNAEESLQDASHLFSTQHPWAQTVRTVVNLEAAGSKGPELLFQATSEDMVEVYQGVPHPYGTVLANDVFASGIMMSE